MGKGRVTDYANVFLVRERVPYYVNSHTITSLGDNIHIRGNILCEWCFIKLLLNHVTELCEHVSNKRKHKMAYGIRIREVIMWFMII